jgi:enamine deaminase RidA (YjgF/YER057c/UK114 family)
MIVTDTKPTAARSTALAPVPDGNWSSPTQVARTVHTASIELSICARPGWPLPGFAEQAKYAYRRLFTTLQAQGASPSDLVCEKIFLSDIEAQIGEIQGIRREFYQADPRFDGSFPAVSYVEQPPADPAQLCEIQAAASLVGEGYIRRMRTLADPPARVSGKITDIDGIRTLYLGNVTGGWSGDGMGFAEQAAAMFRRAEACLRRDGMSFKDVVRTWIYIAEMEKNYDAFNRVRNELFAARGISPSPASTGIQGRIHPADRQCALDLRAVPGDGCSRATPIHAPGMNEASDYGSSFSRGMRLTLSDRSVVFISGTASIDEQGNVVHVGDIEGQVNRMLLNVEQLLRGQGATVKDLVSAITYLKEPEFMQPFRDVCRRRGFPERIPNTLCVAEVCRPEWLCEMEAIAVLG